jgi:hypothetical protein
MMKTMEKLNTTVSAPTKTLIANMKAYNVVYERNECVYECRDYSAKLGDLVAYGYCPSAAIENLKALL